MISYDLLQKYNVPVPRYTSYPTVPFWDEEVGASRWEQAIAERLSGGDAEEGISLYVHLPFCESLCTYCGCNKKITTNHDVEDPYITAVLKEWHRYLGLMPERPLIRELHLGGGTPTFFSSANLERLIDGLLSPARVHVKHGFSFEGHPNNTTVEHMETLFELGFRRVSFGVQDNDPEVQRIINRIQPFEHVKRVTGQARETGYTSVNFDLIYGLPLQTVESISRTVETSLSLRPDRVAFYSYAHVPWKSRGQRLFDEQDLPSSGEKLQLYLTGKELFTRAGYTDIGMDHFALPTDELYAAWKEGWLHRNFMGYTTQQTAMMIGLGVSAISDSGNAYVQNEKALHDYYRAVDSGRLPVVRGRLLSSEDTSFRSYILNILCQGSTSFRAEHQTLLERYTFPRLQLLEADGLISWNSQGLSLTETGRHFMRNVCAAFDLYLLRSTQAQTDARFSRAV